MPTPTSSELVISALCHLDNNNIEDAETNLIAASKQGDAAGSLCLVFFYRHYSLNEHRASFCEARYMAIIADKKTTSEEAHEKQLFAWLEKQSVSNRTLARYIQGHIHLHGLGTPIDIEEAYKCYSEAAQDHFAPAEYSLGRMFDAGTWVDKNHNTAVSWYQSSAMHGYAPAQNHLGLMLQHGLTVNQDITLASFWLSEAAEQGYAEAQYNFALLYPLIFGLDEDNKETPALPWLIKAAEQGHAGAQYNLGLMYEHGLGVVKDPVQAAQKWYPKAAARKHPVAQYNLALMYENGRGVAQDYHKAIELYQMAAKHHHYVPAYYRLALIAEYGRGAEIAKNNLLAARLYGHVAEKGDANAQYRLALMYEYGRGEVPKNEVMAHDLYLKAANQGHTGAQLRLGLIYQMGKDTIAQDYQQAALWYWEAAKRGFASAQRNLARMYERGEGVPLSNENAATLYELAAEQGDALAQNSLGIMYETGRGVTRNYKIAANLYWKAAEQELATAKNNLAILCFSGRVGVSKNPAKAFELFYQAALQGNQNALQNIKVFFSAKNSGHSNRNSSSSSDQIRQKLEDIIKKLSPELSMLMAVHEQVHNLDAGNRLFLLQEYHKWYAYLFERVKKYMAVLDNLRTAQAVMVNAFELAEAFKNLPYFINDINYSAGKDSPFFVRYYPDLDAWAFGSKSVAIADKVYALYCELKAEQQLATSSPQVQTLHHFKNYTKKQDQALEYLSSRAWPGEVNIKTTYNNIKSDFEAYQEKMKNGSSSTNEMSQEHPCFPEILALAVQFFEELAKNGQETATSDQLREFLKTFCEKIKSERQQYQNYPSLEALLHDYESLASLFFELVDSKIAESNVTFSARLRLA